jgi:hypothetical protein
MAQNALTVTASNPTPPTNLIFVGNTPPLDPAQAFADDGIPKALPNATTAGTNASTINEATGSTWPVGITFATSTAAANTAGAPGANISVTHEARGTETSSTAASATPNPLGQYVMVGVGPAMPALTALSPPFSPNANHASSLSALTPTVPTTTGATGASNVSGVGTTLLTVTGTNYDRSCVVNLNGVPQPTNYVSATSLTVTNALKRTTAGTLPVTVTKQSSGVTTGSTNWTLS